jgi:hypothetical protein
MLDVMESKMFGFLLVIFLSMGVMVDSLFMHNVVRPAMESLGTGETTTSLGQGLSTPFFPTR